MVYDYNSLLVESDNTSTTLDQEFAGDVEFAIPKGSKISLKCYPFLNKEKYATDRRAIVTIKWHYDFYKWIDYLVAVQYYGDYTDLSNVYKETYAMLEDSILRAEEEYTRTHPSVKLSYFFQNPKLKDLANDISNWFRSGK